MSQAKPNCWRTLCDDGNSNISFVGCLLAERALRESVPVYTKNLRDFRSQGVEVPDPLPS